MPYGRLDDKANGNAKLLALSDSAWRMWGCALIYCQDNLTDGFVPDHAIHAFGVRAKNKEHLVATELCLSLVPGKAPLWHVEAGGYRVHHYLVWNDSKETVLKIRADKKKRMADWRAKKLVEEQSPGDVPVDVPQSMEHEGEHEGKHPTPPVVRGSLRTKETVTNPTNAELRAMPRVSVGAHRSHALCGRPCIHAQQFRRFISNLGGNESVAEKRIEAWFDQVNAAYAGSELPVADIFKFWDAEYDREFGGKKAVVEGSSRGPTNCRHKPRCRTDLEHSDLYRKELRQG